MVVNHLTTGAAVPLHSNVMPRNVLLIARNFAPVSHVSAERAIKLAKYLPRFGWRPTVLTGARPTAGLAEDPALLDQVSSVPVIRTRAPSSRCSTPPDPAERPRPHPTAARRSGAPGIRSPAWSRTRRSSGIPSRFARRSARRGTTHGMPSLPRSSPDRPNDRAHRRVAAGNSYIADFSQRADHALPGAAAARADRRSRAADDPGRRRRRGGRRALRGACVRRHPAGGRPAAPCDPERLR